MILGFLQEIPLLSSIFGSRALYELLYIIYICIYFHIQLSVRYVVPGFFPSLPRLLPSTFYAKRVLLSGVPREFLTLRSLFTDSKVCQRIRKSACPLDSKEGVNNFWRIYRREGRNRPSNFTFVSNCLDIDITSYRHYYCCCRIYGYREEIDLRVFAIHVHNFIIWKGTLTYSLVL